MLMPDILYIAIRAPWITVEVGGDTGYQEFIAIFSIIPPPIKFLLVDCCMPSSLYTPLLQLDLFACVHLSAHINFTEICLSKYSDAWVPCGCVCSVCSRDQGHSVWV